MKVRIYEWMRISARNGAAMIEAKCKHGENYTGLEWPDRWFYGLLGEECFRQVLEANEKRFIYIEHYDRVADITDFKVCFDGFIRKLNVKTRTNARHDMLLPVAQFEKHHHDLYLTGHVEGDELCYDGWATRSEAEAYAIRKLRIPTRVIPRGRLHWTEALIKRLG